MLTCIATRRAIVGLEVVAILAGGSTIASLLRVASIALLLMVVYSIALLSIALLPIGLCWRSQAAPHSQITLSLPMKGFLTCLQQGLSDQMWAGSMVWVPEPPAQDAKRYGKEAVPGSWQEANRLASQRVTDHKQARMTRRSV